MNTTLHITSGDSVGGSLVRSGLAGELLVWHDLLYDGPRNPGWPTEDTLDARAVFLETATAGGLSWTVVQETLAAQYRQLAASGDYAHRVLWFDACLFDQSMLAHILTCLWQKGIRTAELLCIDAFPGIEPYNGVGQLAPAQLAAQYDRRRPVTEAQFLLAQKVDWAFAVQSIPALTELARLSDAPLPWVPAAAARWLQEQPDPHTGLGRLDRLALEAIRGGCETPAEIFKATAARDTHPQYWGDTTLWAHINALVDRDPPLVHIEGPRPRLPQWGGAEGVAGFRITCLPKAKSASAASAGAGAAL